MDLTDWKRREIREQIDKDPMVRQGRLSKILEISQATVSRSLAALGAMRGAYGWYIPVVPWKSIFAALDKAGLAEEADRMSLAVIPPKEEETSSQGTV
jgi:hypothetical protein